MFAYRLFLTLAAPILALRLLRRRDEAEERLGGRGPATVRRGPVIWLHAASNGELASARGLVERILHRLPDGRMLITTNTATGRALAKSWGFERLDARLAPLDYRLCLQRFLGAWQPDALILIENELWPNRLAEMARLGRPVLVLGARLSDRSARRWRFFPGIVRPMLGAVSYLSAQDAGSRARFAGLGLDESRAGPDVDLKSGSAGATAPDPAELARLAPLFPRAETVLAASTHEGEEHVILQGFAKALKSRPGLRLILAPRHPRRAPEIAQIIRRSRLSFAVRSAGETPDGDTPVYLADTMGEMALWYTLAGITFIGGSLIDRGGHTPYEPAAHGSALLHGPHVSNFADVYAALSKAGATREVATADEFAAALIELDAGGQAAMTEFADDAIERLRARGAGLEPLMAALARLVAAPSLAEPTPEEETAT